MKAKIKSTGEIVEVKPCKKTVDIPMIVYEDENGFTILGCDLNLNNSAKKQTVTIDAWVARDDNNLISLYEEKPSKKVSFYVGRFWALLREEDFPSVTFENSPKKVKVTIELEEEV